MFHTMERIKEGQNPLIGPVYFNESYADPRGFIKMPFGWKNAPNVYHNGADKNCVIWLYPYRSYDLVGKLKYWTKHRKNRKNRLSDLTHDDIVNDDASLVAKVMDATARPKVIRDVAAEFANKILGVRIAIAKIQFFKDRIFLKN